MKKLITLAFCMGALFMAHAQQPAAPAANPSGAEIKFTEELHDFGIIPQGIPASYEFTFKNTGKEPLIIKDATASCGCTKPEFDPKPVLPGKTGHIKATFNAAGVGPFNKTITVTSNAQTPTVVIQIKGTVKEKPAAPAPATTPAPAK